ncbi:hypothetical protein EsVE80_10830 [Enterococcus saigonensis]|uniref:MurNAc-LAA domain-containing protein n=1 Tax=Enterococcus saigonensis TaxID=1805431 RepID=A0A679IB65_9ENTE|nr:N-acetylmuramoyl-L-alanine amidase [Enterococcus saigonensis]BCA85560.1 hypothetical protein EsVE80_10830 [Enterococcus saigonensis]
MKKLKFTIGILMIMLGFFGVIWQRKEQNEIQSQPVPLSNKTSFMTVADNKSLTVSSQKVQIHVDPALYSTTVETENDYVALKKYPNSNSTTIDKLYRGEWGMYLGSQNGWIKINTNDGNIGWVKKENTQITTSLRKVNPTLTQLKVVLDAGHGGIDTGAESNDGTLIEKELTLQTVKKIGAALEKIGVNVVYTRTQDNYLALDEIAEKSMRESADLFISIHYDKYDYDNGMNGQTTYYYYQDDKFMATVINTALANNLTLGNNGVRQGNYFVLRQSNRPSLLLELGYLNSDRDVAIIKQTDFQNKVATGIVAGLRTYVNELEANK